MSKEAMNQTIRFILTRSFNYIEPDITSMIFKINYKYPVLLDTLLPYSKK